MLIFALESGGVSYAWNSIPIVVSLVVGSISLILFAVWQGIISNPARTMAQTVLPLFPAHLATHRIIGFSLLYVHCQFRLLIFSLLQCRLLDRLSLHGHAYFAASKIPTTERKDPGGGRH